MLNNLPKPAHIGIGVACCAASLGLLILGIFMWTGASGGGATKMLLTVGVLGILMGIALVGNALGYIKD